MYLKYGTYSHASGECTLSSITREGLFTTNLQQYAVREKWTIDGRLQIADQGTAAANQAAMTTAITALKTAYNTNGRDLGFYDDSGNLTAHYITSKSATGGVRIVQPPSFVEGRGAEYSTFRTYQIGIEAEFGFLIPGGSKLTSWSESVRFWGGGPKVTFLSCLTGPPQKQLVNQMTTFKASQTGRATALGIYQQAPGPLWPADELIDQRDGSLEIPPDSSNQRITTWEYQFESIAPMFAYPTNRNVV